jgi:hypothetical protein
MFPNRSGRRVLAQYLPQYYGAEKSVAIGVRPISEASISVT